LTNIDDLARFKETVISELFCEFLSIKALKTNREVPSVLPAESSLLSGFQGAFKKRKFPSTFVFSVHLYCDTRYIMEEEVSWPFEQIQQTANSASQSLQLARDAIRWPQVQHPREHPLALGRGEPIHAL
jgi:hypothetical protein